MRLKKESKVRGKLPLVTKDLVNYNSKNLAKKSLVKENMTKDNLLVTFHVLNLDQIEKTETTQKHTLNINHIYR